MPLTLVLALGLAALPSAAQDFRRSPTLIIDLNDPGRLRAWLSSPIPVTAPVAQAFTAAMGCPAAAGPASTRGSNRAEVDCPASLKKDGLRWSAHWEFTSLNAQLARAGARAIEIDIHHPRSGFSTVRPSALFESREAGSGVSYHGCPGLGEFHEIALEAGLYPRQVWRLAMVAGVILLLPLLLFPARAAGPLAALAGGNLLFCVAATAWLEATLPVNLLAAAPLPWNLAILAAPLLAAVWTGARIAGGRHRRVYFWRGVRAVAFLVLIACFFSPGSSLIPSAACCAAVIFAGFWRLHRAGGRRLQPVADGELWDRVRQLALRAGTTVKSMQLLTGGEDVPAAFATRFGGILLTRSLLGALSRREVDAIVCHELSHMRRPRIAAARGVVLLLPAAMVLGTLVPPSLAWMPLLLLPAFLLDRALRRRNERLADADAVAWSRDAEALITGLVRVTLAHGMPLEWPRWVRPLMPHPSTMQRARAAAAQARIPDQRLEQLLTESAAPPADGYPITGSSVPAGFVFTPAERARLNARLWLAGAAVPIAFGVAAPFMGYIAALLAGAVTACLAYELVLWHTRTGVRRRLPGRPGAFAGFSPSIEARVYEGSYDYDWGFAAFEADCLVFRGDRCTFAVARREIERVWLAAGPSGWLARPMVCFQMKSGPAFRVRPFDNSFGPAATRAAARLLAQAVQWHGAPDTGSVSTGNFDFASVTGQPPARFTWRMVLRWLPRCGGITLAIYGTIVALTPVTTWPDAELLGPVVITSALLLFVVYPSIRLSRRASAPYSAPLAPAAPPGPGR